MPAACAQRVEDPPAPDVAFYEDLNVFLDNLAVTFEAPPRLIDGQPMVPMYGIFEALGAEVNWKDDTQEFEAYKDGTTLWMRAGHEAMIVDKPGYIVAHDISLNVPPQVIDGIMFVPVMDILDGFGFGATWDGVNAVMITSSAVDARITFMVQEYIGYNIAEIPYIEYDGDRRDSIDALNRSLNQGIRQIYDDFMNGLTEDDPSWIEIKSFPFTTDKRLQVVITYATFPSYGTDGEIFSVNYDKVNDIWLGIDYALHLEGLGFEDFEESVMRLFEPDIPSHVIEDIKIGGFIIHEGDAGMYVQFFLELITTAESFGPWTSFYSFAPRFDSLFILDTSFMFEPGDLDKMDPPLHYQPEFRAN